MGIYDDFPQAHHYAINAPHAQQWNEMQRDAERNVRWKGVPTKVHNHRQGEDCVSDCRVITLASLGLSTTGHASL